MSHDITPSDEVETEEDERPNRRRRLAEQAAEGNTEFEEVSLCSQYLIIHTQTP